MRAARKFFLLLVIFGAACLVQGCGFHLRGDTQLSLPLQRVYLQTQDPYGELARNVRNYLKTSNVDVVDSAIEASTILDILREEHSEQLVSIGGTQLTRQYNLVLTVSFQVTSSQGVTLVPTQSVSETRSVTIQSNQILGGSNEEANLYDDMRRAIVFDIMSRLSSREVKNMIEAERTPVKTKKIAATS
jgi:LPS-assembly lipoprotein